MATSGRSSRNACAADVRRLIPGLATTLALGAALWWLADDGSARVLSPSALAAAAPTPPAAPSGSKLRAAAPDHGAPDLVPPIDPLAAPGDSHEDEVAAANRLEARVVRAWQLARQGRGTEADALLEAVLSEVPQFRPALTLHGLLSAEWSQPAPDVEDVAPPARRLQPPQALSDESSLRFAAWLHQASRHRMLPGNLLQLGSGVHTLLAADLAESRLYVLHHDAHGLALRGDFYLSTGARGSFKQNPGDQRTPIGVYSLLPRLPASQLPPIAGHGAWPLSFPNRWDQWQGHLGSGIWLHGAAPGQYDGLPHSTNGCLALSNDDLDQLAPLLADSGTVLLVADHLDWISPASLAQRRAAALQRLVARAGTARRLQPDDSLYAYPGDAGLLLVRRVDGDRDARDEFWPAGALEPLAALRTASRSAGNGAL